LRVITSHASAGPDRSKMCPDWERLVGERPQLRSRVHHGWVILAASFLTLAVMYGGGR
jgi:hypothetical protein